MDKKIWVVNRAEKDFEKTDIDLKKHLIFKPFIPIQMPLRLAIRYVKQYKTLSIVDDVTQYFKDVKLKQIITRDAGIGDLLMLEPIMRQLVVNGERQISILSRYPAVYFNNPHITENLKQDRKEIIPKEVKMSEYDAWEDLRGYSETCPNRDKLHRTDCYNQRFDISLKDPEPRIYFEKDEKSILERKDGKIYIGLAPDGSHTYRRYDRSVELINFLLRQNPNYIIVLMAAYDFVKYKKNKRVIDLQGETDIRQAINVTRDLDYMISVDSGMMHVALCMHIPTVCIFSIIKPELRLHYYKGPHQIIYRDADLNCMGCGSFHMAICRHGDKEKDPEFIAPCLDIPAEDIYKKLILMSPNKTKRIFFADEKVKEQEKPEKINIIKHTNGRKLIMPIIVQDEEKNLPRFIELVMKNPAIGKVIAIDGGSNDKTVELLKKAGAFVYIHPYDKDYHDMQAMQRNYSCSFVPDGEKVIIMDIDECFSQELADYLPELAGNGTQYGVISRRTFDTYEDSKHSERRIKDYPDYQPRFFTWNRRFKWIGSPHHNVYNVPEPVKIDKDIIHFEKEGKDRNALEKQWADMDKKTKEIYA